MTELFKSIRLFISLSVPYLIWFIPRSPNIWVYGGRNGKFVDNTKYWFFWANQNLVDIKHVWITGDSETLKNLRSNNYRVFKPFSIQGLYYILRGKIFFYTHGASSIIRPIFLKSAIKFDFFHGIPLKSMGIKSTEVFAQQFGPTFKFDFSRRLYQYYQKTYVYSDHLVIPSKLFTEMFVDFSGKRLYAGYPRNIVFQLNENELLKIIGLSSGDVEFYNEISTYSKRYIYMPTFREGKPDFVKEAFDELSVLNEIMVDQNAVFLFKLHPYTNTKIDLTQYSNIKMVDNQIDIYPFLPNIDCLITDYSSISMDYYFAKHPVIFYLFDLDEFINTSRVLDFNPVQLAEKSTALNWKALLILLRNNEDLPLLDDQAGKGHFLSHIPPDLKKLAGFIKHELLNIE